MEVVYLKIFIDLYNLPPLLSNLRRTNEVLSRIIGKEVVLDRNFENLLFDIKLCLYFKEKYKGRQVRRYRDAIVLINRLVGKNKSNIISKNGCLSGSIKNYKDKLFKIKFHSEEYNYFIACTEKLLTQYKKGKIYVILSIGSQTKNVIDYIIDYLKRKIHDLQYEPVEIVPKEEVIIFYRG